jgi:hypothetical protein
MCRKQYTIIVNTVANPSKYQIPELVICSNVNGNIKDNNQLHIVNNPIDSIGSNVNPNTTDNNTFICLFEN